jgi:hypothetical protein
MTYRGIVSNGVVVLEGDKPTDGTVVEVTPVTVNFWTSPTLEELARSQDVRPMTDARTLFGTWPGEENDGFEAAIDELRHTGLNGSTNGGTGR